MSVDLLLRALRKLSKGYRKGRGAGGACCSTTNRMAKRHAAKLRRTKRLADKLHKKIVGRFERLKEQLKEEGERVARELEGLMTAHIGRYQTAYVMQLWREGRK